MRALLFGFLTVLWSVCAADTAPEDVQLYLDPDTGEVSSRQAPGHVPLGTYLSAEALAAQQAATARQPPQPGRSRQGRSFLRPATDPYQSLGHRH